MAKALLGYSSAPGALAAAELATLRRKCRDLQAEVDRLAATNDALTTLVAEHHLLDVNERTLVAEPALT